MRVDRKKIELLMAKDCLSTTDVADKAMVTSQTVRRAISGNQIKPKTVGKIAKALGVDVTEILLEEGDE